MNTPFLRGFLTGIVETLPTMHDRGPLSVDLALQRLAEGVTVYQELVITEESAHATAERERQGAQSYAACVLDLGSMGRLAKAWSFLAAGEYLSVDAVWEPTELDPFAGTVDGIEWVAQVDAAGIDLRGRRRDDSCASVTARCDLWFHYLTEALCMDPEDMRPGLGGGPQGTWHIRWSAGALIAESAMQPTGFEDFLKKWSKPFAARHNARLMNDTIERSSTGSVATGAKPRARRLGL